VTRSARPSEDAPLSVIDARAALAAGTTSAVKLVEAALALADSAPAAAVFIGLRREQARREAWESDAMRRAGSAQGVLAGIPVSVKDLFDVAGEVTAAGSAVLAEGPPAARDAVAVERLRRAGAIALGRTNMTELAFSGLGLNPHFGTPRNPAAPAEERIPGGSSSGAAVSVALGIVPAALGTDTGGSVRIPASLCGLVGFKPTARRVPLAGTVPLSPSLDSIGPIAHTVSCCALIDSVLSGAGTAPDSASTELPRRIAVPRDVVWECLDAATGRTLEAVLARLSRAGVALQELPAPELPQVLAVNASGGLSAVECFTAHRQLLERAGARLDPRVRVRIERGGRIPAAEHREILGARAVLQSSFARRLAEYPLWLMPTVPCVAPRVDELASDSAYFEANRLMLRNTSLVNFLDGCAVTLPCHEPGALPVGVSLVAAAGMDRQLLGAAARLQTLVRSM